MTHQCEKKVYNKNVLNISPFHAKLRAFKACTIIDEFNPKTAKDIAKILVNKRNPNAKTIYDIEYPFLMENKELEWFVEKNMEHGYENFKNHYISHLDTVDTTGDIWKVSKPLKKKYRTRTKMFMGENIGEGWLKLLKDVEKEEKILKATK